MLPTSIILPSIPSSQRAGNARSMCVVTKSWPKTRVLEPVSGHTTCTRRLHAALVLDRFRFQTRFSHSHDAGSEGMILINREICQSLIRLIAGTVRRAVCVRVARMRRSRPFTKIYYSHFLYLFSIVDNSKKICNHTLYISDYFDGRI